MHFANIENVHLCLCNPCNVLYPASPIALGVFQLPCSHDSCQVRVCLCPQRNHLSPVLRMPSLAIFGALTASSIRGAVSIDINNIIEVHANTY